MIRSATQLMGRYSHVNWALADQALVSGVNFLTGILLARYLGLEEFGRFTLVWMAVLFMNSLQYAAIISPMMSIGPKQAADDEAAYYGAVAAQQVGFAALSATLVFAGILLSGLVFPEWQVANLALPLALAAFAFQMQDFLRRYHFTRQRPAMAFASDTVRYLGQLAALIALFTAMDLDSRGVLWVIATTAIAATAIAGIGEPGRLAWKPGCLRTVTRKHWRFGKWLVASGVMQWLSGNLFILATGSILGAAAVGGLRAALNLMGITHILFQGLENVIPVRAAWHIRNGGEPMMWMYLTRAAVYGGLATAAVSAAAFAAPGFWLELIFGNEYRDFAGLLRWFAVMYPILFLCGPVRAGLRAIEHTRPIFVSSLLTAAFSVLSAYPAVVYLGLTGAGGGMLAVNLIMVATLFHAVRKRIS